MISVICCYNRYTEYCNMLETLSKQNVAHEVIGIDNTNQLFSSAAAALNYGAQKASGDYFVFLHQDILFLEKDSLAEFVEPLKLCEGELCVVGLYGASRSKGVTYKGYSVKDTLDECCVAMHKDTWCRVPFNEELCDGWHLYAVEQCIRIGMEGGIVLSGNFRMEHLSSGNVDDSYMKTFKQLMDHYKTQKWIVTTCKSLPNNDFVYYIYLILWKVKKFFLGNIRLVFMIQTAFRKKENT